ncbi:MAG: response regulator transcription factor [Clostridiales bacterium]|nr:response regulator transcription factor [Clostridiales bacterium]
MYKIFIVEDDGIIASKIKQHIIEWGLEAKCAGSFRNVLEEFLAYAPQLVLMDIGLPFFNGYHWCQEIRKSSDVPIIFLSSASDNMNIVMAVNMGGDDFVAKPFDMGVLTAKIQAALRRAYGYTAQQPVLSCRGVTLDPTDASLTYGDKKLELSRNEYRILHVLMERAGQTVSRELIMERLWETDDFVDENTLSVNVARLRKKLAGIGLEDFVVTRKGAGYQIGTEDAGK